MNEQVLIVIIFISLVSGRQINQAGISLIKEMEGFRVNFYLDQIGIKTIGYGHACHVHDCSKVHPPLTEAQATQLMLQDLVEFENCVQNSAPGLSDNQFAACVSFTFNMGCGTFTGSSILTHIRARNFAAAANDFNQYVSAGGRVLPGLIRRRQLERALFLR